MLFFFFFFKYALFKHPRAPNTTHFHLYVSMFLHDLDVSILPNNSYHDLIPTPVCTLYTRIVLYRIIVLCCHRLSICTDSIWLVLQKWTMMIIHFSLEGSVLDVSIHLYLSQHFLLGVRCNSHFFLNLAGGIFPFNPWQISLINTAIYRQITIRSENNIFDLAFILFELSYISLSSLLVYDRTIFS